MHDILSVYKFFNEYFKTQPEKRIYVMDYCVDYLRILFGFKKDHLIKNIDEVKDSDELHDVFVVLNFSYQSSVEGSYRSSLPEFRKKPPKDWKLKKIIIGKDISYDREFNPEIYYAPP